MPIDKDFDTGGVTPADERAEAILRQWFARTARPLNSDSAGVIGEAEAIERESRAFADSVRLESEDLVDPRFGRRPGSPGVGPGAERTLDLRDLLIASQVVVDMCEALLEDYKVTAARQQAVETIYDLVQTVPDMIRDAMAPDYQGPSTAPPSGETPPTDDGSGNTPPTGGGSGSTGRTTRSTRAPGDDD